LISDASASGQDRAPARDSTDPTRLAAVETEPAPRIDLTDSEEKVLGMLMHDGRTALSTLASAIGKSENTAARTIEQLRRSGVLDFRILVEPVRYGFATEFFLWLEVEPCFLLDTATTLAEHPATKYLTATTGRSNL